MNYKIRRPRTGVLPFLRWAGSKRLLLEHLATHWQPEYSRYIEPFAGSARLFFHLCPKRAVLGDINSDLIATYEQLKLRPGHVLARLRKWAAEKDVYYHVRSLPPETLAPTVRAARFIYLNRYCFNGLYRTNLRGQFNVPWGGTKTGRILDAEAFKECSRVLSETKLVTGDFESVLKLASSRDFIYMDPPFSTASRRVFIEYNKAGFSPVDIDRLRASLCRLANKRVAFLVSYVDSPEARFLARDFEHRIVSVKRSIAGFTGARAHSPEMIISFSPNNC